jgi:ribonuclease HI
MQMNITITQTEQSRPDYYVFTDGACSNNGRPTAKAGIGVFFGEGDPRNISRPLAPSIKQTNNTAELTAIIEAFGVIQCDLAAGKRIGICTDSEYAIRCATTYGRRCHAKGWKDDIPNKPLVQQIYTLYDTHKTHAQLVHIRAHTGQTDVFSVGNENADRLANLAIGVEVRRSTAATGGGSEMDVIGGIGGNDRKIYLAVEYAQKDAAKKLGAKWDAKRKKWYVLESDPNMRELCDTYGQRQATQITL